MGSTRHPSLLQINTRVWLGELSARLGRRATFDDIPPAALDELARQGFDWVWPLGVWQTGPMGRAVSRSHTAWRREFENQLPDLTEEDICGSPYAVQRYMAHEDFGGDEALARFRESLRERGIKLLLDFVPNHTALDHPWVAEHPEYYIAGNEADLAREPHNFRRVDSAGGSRVLAYGRDPYFPGWPDTFQLNYRSAALRRAMIEQLSQIAGQCDGVRCDMAMLLLPDVIERTWGDRSAPADGTPAIHEPFWPESIGQVRAAAPGFTFMAEVYWDLEWTLQQHGFDFTYDKRLYDRLHVRDAEAVRGHLRADADYQRKSARFLENHDEPRAASAFPNHIQRAAAVIAYFVPGLRFFHEGQFEGRRQRVSMHLGRRPAEPVDPDIQAFYAKLLDRLKSAIVREGQWQLLSCRPAWEGNPTWKRFIAFAWQGMGGERWVVAVNYGPTTGQCYVHLPFEQMRGKSFLFRDVMGDARYQRDGTDLAQRGLFLDLPEWHYHVFEMVEE